MRKWKRNRQAPETPSGQFCIRPREMMESAAYRVFSRAAHLVLSRIELELRYHGGKNNGRLLVTYEQFESYGLDRGSIAPALRELEALGFIEITQHGRGGNADYRVPNLFRLTYEPDHDGKLTNEWKQFPKGADVDADARMMADADHVASMARKNQNPVAVDRAKKLAQSNTEDRCGKPAPVPVRKTRTENRKLPVRKTHTTGSPQKPTLLSISRGGGPTSPNLHSLKPQNAVGGERRKISSNDLSSG
jgi:hypothetical protein